MGDQRGISEETQEAMRASGLGHVLSISGLHMALVAGSAFWLIRALLALSPGLALTRPIKKWAAAGALGVATFYLAHLGRGGGDRSASYIMLAVMLVAVMLDRRAITLRNVALAALVVLAHRAREPAQRQLPDVVRRDARAGRRLRGACARGPTARLDLPTAADPALARLGRGRPRACS